MKQLVVIEGSSQLKCWNRAIGCVTKLGEYVSFEITPECVSIGAFNQSASALASMKFTNKFFRSVKVSGISGQTDRRSASLEQHGGFHAQFQLHSKTLNSIFRRIDKDGSGVQICKILFKEQINDDRRSNHAKTTQKHATRRRKHKRPWPLRKQQPMADKSAAVAGIGNKRRKTSISTSANGLADASPGLFVGDSEPEQEDSSDDRSYEPEKRTNERPRTSDSYQNEYEYDSSDSDSESDLDLDLDIDDLEDDRDLSRAVSITMDVEMVCQNGLSKFFSTPCMDTRQVYNDSMDKQKCSGWFRCDSKFLKNCLDHVTGRPEELELEFESGRISLTTLTRGINLGKEILKFPMSTRIDIEPDQLECIDVRVGSRLCIRHKEFMVMIAFAESLQQMSSSSSAAAGELVQKTLMFEKIKDSSGGKVVLDAYIYKPGYPMSYEISSSLVPEGASFKFLFMTMALDDDTEESDQSEEEDPGEEDESGYVKAEHSSRSQFVPYVDHKHERLVKKINQPFHVTEKRGPGLMPTAKAHINLMSFGGGGEGLSSTPLPTITMSDLESDNSEEDAYIKDDSHAGTVTWIRGEGDGYNNDTGVEDVTGAAEMDLTGDLTRDLTKELDEEGLNSASVTQDRVYEGDQDSTIAIGPTQGVSRVKGLFD